MLARECAWQIVGQDPFKGMGGGWLLCNETAYIHQYFNRLCHAFVSVTAPPIGGHNIPFSRDLVNKLRNLLSLQALKFYWIGPGRMLCHLSGPAVISLVAMTIWFAQFLFFFKCFLSICDLDFFLIDFWP